ncbi:MAG TPA: hypothetical protein VNH15_05760 [Elusimicrobiota bacterium]|nr:hypothetical protein [Elusimicrobiota bacterium]
MAKTRSILVAAVIFASASIALSQTTSGSQGQPDKGAPVSDQDTRSTPPPPPKPKSSIQLNTNGSAYKALVTGPCPGGTFNFGDGCRQPDSFQDCSSLNGKGKEVFDQCQEAFTQQNTGRLPVKPESTQLDANSLTVPAPHEEAGVPTPKPKDPQSANANRNGMLFAGYSGYLAMSLFGFGLGGLLFAAAGGYLFGNHLWHVENPSKKS